MPFGTPVALRIVYEFKHLSVENNIPELQHL